MIYEVYPIYHQEKKDARIEEILSGGTSDGGLECLKQTDQRGLYRYLPSVDNGCAGGLKSQLTKKCQDCPSVGILMVMRLAATILLTEDMSKSSFSLKSHFQIKGILKTSQENRIQNIELYKEMQEQLRVKILEEQIK